MSPFFYSVFYDFYIFLHFFLYSSVHAPNRRKLMRDFEYVQNKSYSKEQTVHKYLLLFEEITNHL